MDGIKTDIIRALEDEPGLSDMELAEYVQGPGASPQYINQCCKALEQQEVLSRKKRKDGRIGNWLNEQNHFKIETRTEYVSEKNLKQVLEKYLSSQGWQFETAWELRKHGIDIEARRGNERWIIQVKGPGSFRYRAVDNFLMVLGEIIQRVDDPYCKYSIALPDLEQFRRLWKRLPEISKSRLGITALFVNQENKTVEEV